MRAESKQTGNYDYRIAKKENPVVKALVPAVEQSAAGKFFEQAIESPMGGIYEAQAAAEFGKSVVSKQ